MDSTEFFGGPEQAVDPQEFNGHGQYMLDVDGRGKKPYSRATTVAKMLDSGKGLEIWEQRKIAKGVAQSPALTARAAIAPLDDKRVWREIIAAADVLSGGNEKRDLGSAFHELHERVPHMTGEEYAAVHPDLRVTYERYRAELDRLGITEVLTEITVANTQIGTAGKADAVFQLADGRLVIGDRKSGRITEYPHSAAVQLAIYANADTIVEYNEDGSTVRRPMVDVDKQIAIVIDVTIGDADTAAVHVYEIDIWAGWSAALLSANIRRWRNRKDLCTPYHPEFPPADRAMNAATLSGVPAGHAVSTFVPADSPDASFTITPAPVVQVMPASFERTRVEIEADFAAELPPPRGAQPVEVAHGPAANVSSTTPYNGPGSTPHMQSIQAKADELRERAAAKLAGHPAFSSAKQANIVVGPDGTEVSPDAVAKVAAGGPISPENLASAAAAVQDVDALLAKFKTKAQLQAVLAKVDPAANLARTRANLAKDAVSHPNWPNHRREFFPYAKPIVESASVPGVGTVVAQTDVVGEDLVLSDVVSNAPGPVPPDPEPQYTVSGPIQHATVGGQPVPHTDNPFAQAAPVAPAESLEDQLLRRIGAATSPRDLEQIWNDANDGGIGWPARLDQAAKIKQSSFTN